jgi:hypothetical protein
MTSRQAIVKAFTEWTAFSALRSGLPTTVRRQRAAIYPLIRIPNYDAIISRQEITPREFNAWHEASTAAICHKAESLPVGWATKIINVYLKTRVYLASEGPSSLVECIHPPIDNGLWQGIRAEYRQDPAIYPKTHIVTRIKNIVDYSTYQTIIEGCELIAAKRGCLLIEVEELWMGTLVDLAEAEE